MKAIKITASEFIEIKSNYTFFEKGNPFYLRPEQIMAVSFIKNSISMLLTDDCTIEISFEKKGHRLSPETIDEYYRIKQGLEKFLDQEDIASIEPPDLAKTFPIHLNSKVRSAHPDHLTTIYLDKTDINKCDKKDNKLIITYGMGETVALTFNNADKKLDELEKTILGFIR
jgi:hypothetical protein